MAGGETVRGEAIQGVGHALLEAAPLGVAAGLLLVRFAEAAGLSLEPVDDATPRDGVELAVHRDHAVVGVPGAHPAPGPKPPVVALAAVVLVVGGPSPRLSRELLGAHRLGGG